MSQAAAKAARLAQSMGNIGKAARTAAKDLTTFGRALSFGNLEKAAGIIKSLSMHLTNTANRLRQLKTATGTLPSLFNNLAKSALTAATAFSRLDRSLVSMGPRLRVVVGQLAALGAALRGSAGSYRISISGLNNTDRAARKASTGIRGVTGAFTHSGSAARRYARDLQIANSKMLSLAAVVVRTRNLLFYLATGFGVRALFQMTDAYKLMNSRLMIVSKTAAEAGASFNALAQSSNRTRTPIEENVKAFTRFRIAGERYGMTAAHALRLTENFNKMLIISGATTSEAAAATQQLSQAFAKGRLDGDEFRSIMENAGVAGQLLGSELKDLGIDMGNLRKAAKDGRIDIEAMMKAFASEDVTRRMEEKFKKIPLTMSQAFTVARNNLILWLGKLDEAGGFTSKLAHWIVQLSYHYDDLARAIAITAGLFAASYIPRLVEVIKLTRVLIALQFASHLTGLSAAAKGAAASVGLWSGVMKTSAASSLTPFAQRLGNLKAAASLTMSTMGTAFRTFFLRVPALATVGIIAMASWEKEVKKVGKTSVQVGDFVMAGLGMIGEGIWNFLKEAFNSLVSFLKAAGNAAIKVIDAIYRAVKGVIAAVKSVGNLKFGVAKVGMFSVPTIDASGVDIVGAYNQAYNSGGIKADFGALVSGTEWERRAVARAQNRENPYPETPLGDPNSELDYDKAAGDGSGKGGKSKAKKTKDEIDQLRDALKSLAAQIDETESKRQEFNDGLDTLTKSLDAGLISADKYKQMLGQLASNIFPGLKEELKDLNEQNMELQLRAAGASEWEIEFRKAADTTKEQVEMIDTIIAKDGDRTGILGEQRQILLDQLDTYGRTLAINHELNAAAEARKKREEQIREIIKDASNQLFDMFTSRLRDALDLGKNSFKDFFKSILSFFKDMLAKVIGAMVFAPLQQQFQNAMEKAFGIPQTGKVGAVAVGSGAVTPSQEQTINTVITMAGGGTQSSSKVQTGDGGSVTINVPPIPMDSGTIGSGEGQGDITVTAKKWGFFDHFMYGYKSVFNEWGKLFKPVGDALTGVAKKMGASEKTLGQIGEKMGQAVAGFQTGTMVAAVGKMFWDKFSTTGAQVGGAIGAVVPIPGGDIIGAIIGGVIGGLLKGDKGASAKISDVTGEPIVTGKKKGGEMDTIATNLAKSVQQGLADIANYLGAEIGDFKVSIGILNGKYVVDELGQNRLKGPGTPSFATAEEAIAHAIKIAIQQGAIKGLSETADKYLKSAEDLDRAVRNILMFEQIKDRAASLKDPLGGAFTEFGKQLEDLIEVFTEMGATAEDWADLQKVAQHDFDQILNGLIKGLKDFRDSLTSGDLSYLSPIEKLRAAEAKFSDIEARIASGEFVPQDEFLEAASNLINLARDVYGSTPEFAVYQDRVLAATDAMIEAVENQASQYQGIIDAITQQTTVQTEQLNTIIGLLGGSPPASSGVASGGGGGGTSSGSILVGPDKF